MADISSFLEKILEAVYGEEVRGSIYDALAAMNVESNAAMNFAATAKDSAMASANAAKESEANAAASESAAKASEQNAAASELSTAESAVEAMNAAAGAKISETNAANSESAAKTAEANAKASETAAKASQDSAAASAATATEQANAAFDSASTAHTSETNAANSESAAKVSETNAASSAATATEQATSASASAEAAKASEDSAARSETAAKTSETSAGNFAKAASDSATAAKTSETNAAQSAADANAGFTAAKMNFGGTFNFGGWPSTPGEKFMPRPCMLTYAGTVDHYLNPNDYTKKVDGTASKVADTSFGGNAMMEWPKIFVKRWEDANGYHFRCSDMKLDDSYECWSNYDRQNHEIDHFYTPIYFGSNVSSKMRSISGQANSVRTTADTEITLAKANGADWYTEVVADRMLINDLLTMMAKSTDMQSAYGSGVTGASAAIAPGTMNTKGMFWGSNDKTSGVKVFGMENYWGNIFRRTAGWMLVNGVQKVKLTRGTKDGSTAADYNTTGDGYKALSSATPTGSSGGYISKCKTEAFGRFPYGLSGSATTFECDAMYYNNSGTFYAFVGGYWAYGLLAGAFCVYLSSAPSISSASVGAALSCKPLAA